MQIRKTIMTFKFLYIPPKSSNSPNLGIYISFIPKFCSYQLGLCLHNLFAPSPIVL